VKPQCLFLVCCLLLLAVEVGAQDEPAIRSAGNIQLTGAEDPSTSKVYIVQLSLPSAAEHHVSLAKKARTVSPRVNEPLPRFRKDSAAVQAYVSKLDEEQRRIFGKAGPGARKIYNYKYGLNGFAARMSVADAQKIRGLPEVLNVWEDEIRPLATRHSANFLGLFDSTGGLRSEHALDGDGVVIGIIDSGISPEHPALQDSRAADRPRACRSSWGETTILGKWLCRHYDRQPDVPEFEELEGWSGECESGDRFEEDTCNNKLIGARWFVDGAADTGPIDENDFRSPRDADGHGTHTATTAAGNRTSASIFGTLIGESLEPVAIRRILLEPLTPQSQMASISSVTR
jgi:subtilisin family serine protease